MRTTLWNAACAVLMVGCSSFLNSSTSTIALVTLPPDNLIPNPSFEADLSGWTGSQSALSRVELKDAPNGMYAAKVTQAAGTTFSIDTAQPPVLSTVAGAAYAGAAWVRGVPSSSRSPVQLVLTERDPSGQIVQQWSARVVLSNSFQQLQVSAQAVQNGDTLELDVAELQAKAGDAFYVDAVSLTQALPDAGSGVGSDAGSGSDGGWVNVIYDTFDDGGVPSHWELYDGPYASGPQNCAIPSHVTVSGGAMHLLMSYETSGTCGAGWYTGGMMISSTYGSIDQRITVRFRIVENGVYGHHIIPMRFPDGYPWPQGGEEDLCEGEGPTDCWTFLHYGDTADTQIYHAYTIDLSQWHVVQFVRRNYTVTTYIDDMTTPVWTYQGSATTLPDTIHRAVLQQECPAAACPSGTTGTEDIQIDWISIDNPT